ncbi:thiamine-phosphate kinase [bacterium]|nr:thiamine-phosphate kinase [bacterium]
MNKEFEFLKTINKIFPNRFLGNDCAYLDKYSIAISQDSLIEDVHFSRQFMTPYEIAQKALLVNISDILASGAKAEYFSIGLSGNLDNNFIEEFYQGLYDISKDYSLDLIGGDLTKSDKIMISVTILGNYKNRRISYRQNAREGYIAAAIGEFGSSAQGLYNLQNNIQDNYFINIHKKPVLYPELSSKIAKNTDYPYAMMDSSDGLFDCLYQIAEKSRVKINIDYTKIPHKTNNKDLVLFGGEDYCPVIALHPDDFKKFEDLIQIGTIDKGNGVYIDNQKVEYKSFKHFE